MVPSWWAVPTRHLFQSGLTGQRSIAENSRIVGRRRLLVSQFPYENQDEESPVMDIPFLASIFGKYEFPIRRLHSLTGLIPIGGFLCIHLATNASILDGTEQFQRRVDQIHSLGPITLLLLEWAFIFLPILFHGLIGLVIVTRGKRNLRHYGYSGNWRYTLQRATGVIAMVFIVWHVFHMHGWLKWPWWVEHVARPLGGARFDPEHAATAPATLQASWGLLAVYAIGVLACVYHLANGLWTMGITWGVWTSPTSQRRATIACAAFGVALAVVGLGALVGMQTAEIPDDASLSQGGQQYGIEEKWGPVQFVRSTLRAVPANWTCPHFPPSELGSRPTTYSAFSLDAPNARSSTAPTAHKEP
jgi:succinate dehydrogenase / fumarate reductase cytochrome b subunit